jgi:adenosine deaminase
MTDGDDLTHWLTDLPKVELHVHLEGAIPLEAMWELIRKYGGDPSVPSMAALKKRFTFRNFAHFIQVWVWKNQFLREYDDLTYVSEALARHFVGQNIKYAEVFCSSVRFTDQGLETQRLFEAIRSGLSRVPEVEVLLIPDLVRDYGPDRALTTLRDIAEARDYGIIGIGLGGSEQRFPPELFREVYDEARKRGLHTTAHAGEAAGAESVWSALKTLEVERIGHGTRAEEDPALLDYLAETQIPLEMCPLSNVCTGVVDSIDAHPVRRYVDLGLLVTINSDDPMMFGNSLLEEYRVLNQVHGFHKDEIRTLVLNSIQAAWLPSERKEQLRAACAID